MRISLSSDIRGFYFTSGTQEGQPLDRVLSEMRDACGLQAEEENQVEEPVDKKAYFIDDLFTEVVFPDKELARSSASAEKRRELLRRIGTIATIAATALISIVLIVAYTSHSSLIGRAIQTYATAEAFERSDERALEAEQDPLTEMGGPFEQLRVLFEELDENYGALGSYLMGQSDALYDRRIRPLYVRKLRETFIMPLQQRLAAYLDQADQEQGQNRDVADIADRLTCYSMLGDPKNHPLNRTWLRDDFLRRDDMWTWHDGGKTPAACRPHRETFVRRVAGTGKGRWVCLPDEDIIRKASALVREKDIYGKALEEVLQAQNVGGLVPWTKILEGNANAKLLDDTIGVVEAYCERTPLDDALEVRAETLPDEDAADQLKLRRIGEAQKSWSQGFANLRPRGESNLADAARTVHRLTGENSPYVTAYERAGSELSELGLTCKGETGALLTCLEAIHGLKEPVDALCEGTEFMSRIVPAARDAAKGNPDNPNEQGRLGNLRVALREAYRTIRENSEFFDTNLQSSTENALEGLIESIEFALSREIRAETRNEWSKGLGKELARFSGAFPFRSDGKTSVDVGRFQEIFAKDGEFDTEWKWIDYLAKTLDQTKGGRLTEAMSADRKFVDDVQLALFKSEECGCTVEFTLQRRGNVTWVQFTLGDDAMAARGTKVRQFDWQPADPAKIAIQYRLRGDEKFAIEGKGEWGFLRLLQSGESKPNEFDGVKYLTCKWTEFVEQDGRLIATEAGGPTEAMLLFRTEAKPNPLLPEFFVHTFAPEVFGER